MNFATIIREARTSSGVTQDELAARAGVAPNTIWEFETRGSGTVSILTKIVAALDLRFAGLPQGRNFSEQVKTLRARRGWSQAKLAEKAGVSVPTISNLERGNARIATLSAALAVLAPQARVRKPEVTHWGVGGRDERFTPPNLLEKIERVIGPIGLDPCGHPHSKVRAGRTYYIEDDGLAQPWKAQTVYINPPYSLAANFMRKAHASWRAGDCQTVLALLQVQMHHHWVHELLAGQADIFFLRGRIAFDQIGKKPHPAPFGNMIATYGADEAMVERMLSKFDCVQLPRTAKIGRAQARRSTT